MGRRDSVEPARQVIGAAQSGRLSTVFRASSLAALRATAPPGEDELDLLIVGGGVVGAGAALDAATRGLRVGIVASRFNGFIVDGPEYLKSLMVMVATLAVSEPLFDAEADGAAALTLQARARQAAFRDAALDQ